MAAADNKVCKHYFYMVEKLKQKSFSSINSNTHTKKMAPLKEYNNFQQQSSHRSVETNRYVAMEDTDDRHSNFSHY